MLQTIHDDLSPASTSASSDSSFVFVPDTQFLLTATFKRSGADLVLTGADNRSVVVADYFARDEAPDLVGPDGATLTATVVRMLAGPAAPGQYAQATPSDAQATPPASATAIARVDKASGVAQVTHANGVTEPLTPGALIFKGDIIQTGRGSAASISFGDGTALNFSANTRMVMNEFAYEANSTANSGVLTLVHGSFAFIAGQVAKTGGLNIDTPVATMGIRGTTGGVAEVRIYPEVRYQFHAHRDVLADGTLDRPSTYDLNYRTGAGGTSSVKVTYGSVAVLGARGPGQPPQLRIAQVDALDGADAQSARQYQQMVNALVGDYPGLMQNLFPLQPPNQGPGKRGDFDNPGMREVTAYGGAPGSATSVAVIEATNFANAATKTSFGVETVVPPIVAPSAGVTSGVSPNDGRPINGTLENLHTAADNLGVPTVQVASLGLPVLAAALTDFAHEGTLTFARDLLTGASSGNQTPLHIANVAFSVDGGEASSSLPQGLQLNGATLTVDPQDPAFRHLAGGEQKTIVVTYSVVDGHGSAVQQTETITIIGVDDAPTVSAGAPSASLAEAGGVNNGQTGVDASVVVLAKSDVDSVLHYDTTGWLANEDGTFTKVGQYGSATLDPLHDTVTYHLDNAMPATQALTGGQHVTDDFTIAVIEDNGALTAATQVAFAVTGANDAAQIGGTATGSVTEDEEVSTHTGGTLTVTDVDAGEARFQTPDSLAGDYGIFTFDATTGEWTYTLNHADPLTAGQIAHDTLTVKSFDGTASQTIDVAVHGANDAPAITAGEVTGAVTEAVNNSSEEIGNITHQTTGTLVFTDVDLADAHTVVVAPVDAGTGYRGSLSASVSDVSTGDASGAISWTFEVADSALDDLAAGQTLTQSYTVTVSDGHGGTSSQIVTITLNGATDNGFPNASDDLDITPSLVTNSAFSQTPDFTGWTITPIPESNIYRAGNGYNGRDYSYEAYVDRGAGEDGTAVLSFRGWFVPGNAYGTEYGPSIRSDVFTAAGGDVVSFDWLLMSGDDYAVGQGFVRDASTNAIVETVFDYQTGFTGSTGWQHTEYTLSTSGQYYIEFRVGSYDYTGGLLIGAELQLDYAGVVPEIHEDKTLTLQTTQLLANDTDPDGDTLTIIGVEQTSTLGANVHLNGDGTITYDPRVGLAFLEAGQSEVDSFQYTVSDGHGGTDTATVSFTVHGRNDAPAVDLDSQDLTTTGLGYTGSASADGSLSPIALHSSIADPDDNSLASLTITLRDGHLGDFFSEGDLASLGISATVTGSAGAVDDPLTITLSGQASRDSYAAALELISFGTNSTNLDDRHIDVVASDGLSTSATATSTIEIVPANLQFQALFSSASDGAPEADTATEAVFLSGQPGADTFVFGPDDNAPVTIADFTPHTAENAGQADAIDLSEFNFVSFEQDIAPLLHASESGADTIFNLPTGATVTLQNVLVASLHASDFIVQSHI